MLILHQSNRLERLADDLAEVLRVPLAPPLTPETIAVQSNGMARWLRMRLADRLGVSANIDFPLPSSLVWKLFGRILFDVPDHSPYDREVLVWRLMGLLPTIAGGEVFAPLRAYLADAEDDLRRHQLASRIADLFDQYLVYRPDWILDWERGGGESWHAPLWRELVRSVGGIHRVRVQARFLAALDGVPSEPFGLPSRLSLFGIPTLPPAQLEVFARLAERLDVHLFLLNPCRQFWAEIRSEREIARRVKDRDPRELYLETGNSLLAACGKQGRDFLGLLLDYDPHELGEFEEPGEDTLLHCLQTDILTLRNRGEDGAPRTRLRSDDRSVQVHSCHGPMREVEVLYDQLLALFEADPGLEPGDIAVMTPDIEAYAPFIEAVFGTAEPDRRIPFSIADRRQRTESPVVNCLLLPAGDRGRPLRGGPGAGPAGDRAGAPAVRHRGGRPAADPGLDPGDGCALGGGRGEPRRPRPPGNGGAHLARRPGPLAPRLCPARRRPDGSSGASCPTTRSRGQPAGSWAGSAPSPRPSSPRGKSCRAPARSPYGRTSSCASSAASWMPTRTRRSRSPTSAGLPRRWPRRRPRPTSGARCRWRSCGPPSRPRWERARGGGRFLAGRVTFCAMVPMRSVPFQVVCLIGLNDGSYPRSRRAPGFDLMSEDIRIGDRSRRDDDRYLFLEAIVSARRVLYLSYVGQSNRDNAPLPPSVLVSELLDYAERGFAPPEGEGALRDRLVTRHPLHAFSPRYFRGGADGSQLFSYSEEFCEASRRRRTSPGPQPFLAHPLAEPPAEWRTVDLARFIRFFQQPTKYLVRERLRIHLEEQEGLLESREPFTLDGLAAYELRQELLDLRLAGGSPADAWEVARGGGRLPQGRVGEVLFAGEAETVEAFAKRLEERRPAERPDPIPVDCDLGPIRLTGWLTGASGQGLLDYRLTTAKPKDWIALWLRHLLLNSLRPAGVAPESCWVGEEETILLGPVEDPLPRLAALAGIYWAGLSQPLHLFPEASFAYAERLQKGQGEERALAAARTVLGRKRLLEEDTGRTGPVPPPGVSEPGPAGRRLRAAGAGGVLAHAGAPTAMSGRAHGRTRPLDILAEPLEGLRLIEASAGTGKTHTLADLYLRLVLEGGRPVDQILVVTFTVAATAELRDRIRARLEAARGAFERGAPANPRDEVLAGLLARIPEHAAAARRLAQAVQGFDEAAILTIHGFCQRVLKESAFESGQPFEAELVPDEGEILQEVVDDFWRKTLYRGPRLLVGYLLRQGWKPEGLVTIVRPYLRRMSLAVRPPAPPAVGPEAESLYEDRYRQTRGLWETDRAAIETLLRSQTSLNASKYPPRSLPVWLEEIDAFLRPAEAHVAWCARVEKVTTGALRSAAKKGCAPPAHPFFAACERLTEAWQSLVEYLAFRAKELRLELLDYCRRELALRKERRQLTAYQDLLLRLDRALGAPHGAALAAGLRRRYSAALIDEFQDTDPTQYSIFRQIYGASRLPVFLVGDPKQAIFGFRGADIFAYLAAGRDAEARRTLDRNWRSAPGLVRGRERRVRRCRANRSCSTRSSFSRCGRPSRSATSSRWRETTMRRSGSGASPARTSTSRCPRERPRTRRSRPRRPRSRGSSRRPAGARPGSGRRRSAAETSRSWCGPTPRPTGCGRRSSRTASPASSSARPASSRRMRRRRSSASSWPWRSRGASRWSGPPWPRISSAWAGTRWRSSARTRRPGRRGRTRFSSTRPSGGTRDSSRCFAGS